MNSGVPELNSKGNGDLQFQEETFCGSTLFEPLHHHGSASSNIFMLHKSHAIRGPQAADYAKPYSHCGVFPFCEHCFRGSFPSPTRDNPRLNHGSIHVHP